MEKWTNCQLDALYYHDSADIGDECDVTIDGPHISVTYDTDAGPVTYTGTMNGPGHFELQSDAVNGRATLHRFEGGRVLEGYWVEDSVRGMWRIMLPD